MNLAGSRPASRSPSRSRFSAAGRTRRASCRRRARPTTADLPRSTPAGRSLRAGACRGSQQRAAAGDDDAAIDDVGGQLGRRALERDAHRVDDDVDGFGQRLANLFVGDGDRLRHAFDQVAALDLHRHPLVERIRGAELHLDLLGGALADQQVVGLLDVLDDRLIHLVAGDAHRLAVDDAGQRDDGDVGGAAADVDDHAAGRLGDRQAGADRRGHRLFDQVHFAGLGAVGRVLDRALFDLRDFRRHADDDARPHPDVAVVRLLDEVGQHLLGDVEVGDDAVLHRLDGDDVAGRAAEHLLRAACRRPRRGRSPC